MVSLGAIGIVHGAANQMLNGDLNVLGACTIVQSRVVGQVTGTVHVEK